MNKLLAELGADIAFDSVATNLYKVSPPASPLASGAASPPASSSALPQTSGSASSPTTQSVPHSVSPPASQVAPSSGSSAGSNAPSGSANAGSNASSSSNPASNATTASSATASSGITGGVSNLTPSSPASNATPHPASSKSLASPSSPASTATPHPASSKSPASPSSPASNATPAHLASTATSLEELRKSIEAFEDCPLKFTSHNTVFARGSDSPKVFFIGEAPGADEDIQGKPFVGRSGQLLDKILEAARITPSMFRIGNILPWRPPGNRNPTPEEVAMCLPFIERHIELVKPKIVVFLGGVAAHSLLGNEEPISRLRKKWHQFETTHMTSPIWAKPTFHPSYLLRSPSQKRFAWIDFLEIRAKLEELE